jgi:hypothetical protein
MNVPMFPAFMFAGQESDSYGESFHGHIFREGLLTAVQDNVSNRS